MRQPLTSRSVFTLVDVVRERGIRYAASVIGGWLVLPLQRAWFRATARSFLVGGRVYRYLLRAYNLTPRCERAVELPFVQSFAEERSGGRILEIGNVLGHYFPGSHEVIDKYERGEGIRAIDVVELDPAARYDLIVSVSTLEHVGFDEQPRDPAKLRRALRLLQGCLAPGGLMVVTLPIGYNPEVDAFLAGGAEGFARRHFLRRVGRTAWREASAGEALSCAWGHPWPFANGLFLGVAEGLQQTPPPDAPGQPLA